MTPLTIRRNGEFITAPQNLTVPEPLKLDSEVDVHHIESQMDRLLGWQLVNFRLGGAATEAEVSRRFIRHYSNCYPDASFFTQRRDSLFEVHSKPVSMFFPTRVELAQCVSTLYQLMYFHYVLGRHERMKGSFPRHCCGIATRNLTVAAWGSGIVSALSTYNRSEDHAYVVVPFMLGETGELGVILADPTSDQLMHNPDMAVRNTIRLLPDSGWEYRADWAGGRDLYPELVQVSSAKGNANHKYQPFVDEALANPVIVM